MSLAAINPVSDLRDYNKVLKNCRDGEPVVLTKNGRGVFVLIDIKDYEKMVDSLMKAKVVEKATI